MIRFFISALYPIVLLPVYLSWAQKQAEQQIEKMQDAAFSTPGAEAPIPPAVIVAGATGLGGHLLTGCMLLKLTMRQTLTSLMVGGALGGLIFFTRLRQNRQK